MQVQPARITVVVGRSGCGKTTLLNLLGGLDDPTTGRIVRRTLRYGCVFQQPLLVPWLTVRENARFGAAMHGMPDGNTSAEVERLLYRYGLGTVSDAPPRVLSGGMQQRVAIIRALVSRPNVLLLDEPFAHSDFAMRRLLHDDIAARTHDAATAVVLATHDLHEAVQMADEVMLLGGRPTRVVDRVPIDIPRSERSSGRDREIVLAPYVERLWASFESVE